MEEISKQLNDHFDRIISNSEHAEMVLDRMQHRLDVFAILIVVFLVLSMMVVLTPFVAQYFRK